VRVAVFCHSLNEAGGRSVGLNLLRSLPEAGPDLEWLFVVPDDSGYLRAAPEAVTIQTVPRLGRFRRAWWDLRRAPAAARSWRADWVVALGNVPFLRGARSKAVLLHDPHLFYPMRELRHLRWKVKARKALLRLYLRFTLHRQQAIFVQTDVAAGRVADMYRLDPARILVVPNALSAAVIEGGAGPDDLGLPAADFRLLTLTKYAGRKGLETIVAMFERFSELLPGVGAVFTIDVRRSGPARRLMQRIAEAQLGDRIVNIGPVEQSALPGLYAAVDVAVLPSLLESYSGVYAEAMTLGVPIVTSDRDFARAVCGDAAVYVDPEDPASLARAVAGLMADPDRRRSLIEAGHRRAGELATDWRRSAGIVVDALTGPSP
jgi:glycosyltransferase involved in cell wall biosynthesis